MKTQREWLTYAELELIAPAKINSPKPLVFWSILRNMRDNLLLALVAGHEPHISQTIDAEGRIWWRIYHPRTGRSICCESEQEVRVWLDNHFNG